MIREAELEHLDAWFQQVEADTEKLLIDMGGEPADLFEVFPAEVPESGKLTEEQIKCLSAKKRTAYRKQHAIWQLQASLIKMQVARGFARNRELSNAVRFAHAAAIHGMRGAGKFYEKAINRDRGTKREDFDRPESIRRVYDAYLERRKAPTETGRCKLALDDLHRDFKYWLTHKKEFAEETPAPLRDHLGAHPKWVPPKTYRAIQNHVTRNGHRS